MLRKRIFKINLLSNKKSQAAAEMLIVIAIALSILLIILVINNKIMTGTSGKIESTKARTVVDSMADAAELVYQQGVGSRTRVFVTLPDEIQSFTASNQTLAMQLYTGGNLKDTYRAFDFNVSGTLPTEDGNYWLYAEAKQGYVEFSQNITEEDTTPPASVTNMANQSAGTTWIYWTWTNPSDSDFSQAIIYIDGDNEANTSNNYYNATGLSSGTSYTITVHTKDTTGNVNDTDVNNTASTLSTVNQPPTHTTPILNSTFGTNLTTENLTCHNQSTSDSDGDSVKNIFNWYKNETSIMLLNMPFEGGSNTTYTKDYSGNSNDGTVSGATWSNTSGYDGDGAYEFNGVADYISVPVDEMTAGKSEITLMFWVNPDGWTSGKALWDECNGAYWQFSVYTNSWYTRDSSTGASGSRNNDLTVPTMPTGEWHHMAFVYGVEDSLKAIYIDGELNTSTSTSIDALTSNRDFVRIADACDGTNFDGEIDDLMIFNVSLSAEQIKAIYENRTDLIVSQETALSDLWQCEITPDDGNQTGTTLQSNNLTITQETTPPASVTNLENQSQGSTWIYWNWTNPPDSDFDHTEVWINGTFYANVSAPDNFYNATSLSSDSTYEIQTKTADTSGNINTTWVNDTAETTASALDSIDNPSFESEISPSDWTYTEHDGKIYNGRSTSWSSDGSYSYRIYVSGPVSTGDYGMIYQTIDLTGIDTITFDSYASTSYSACQYAEARVYIDNDDTDFGKDTNWYIDLCSGNNGAHSDQSIDVSGFTGTHTFKMELYVTQGANLGTRYIYYDNLRTS